MVFFQFFCAKKCSEKSVFGALGAGSWKLGAGSWKLGAGSWQLAAASWEIDKIEEKQRSRARALKSSTLKRKVN